MILAHASRSRGVDKASLAGEQGGIGRIRPQPSCLVPKALESAMSLSLRCSVSLEITLVGSSAPMADVSFAWALKTPYSCHLEGWRQIMSATRGTIGLGLVRHNVGPSYFASLVNGSRCDRGDFPDVTGQQSENVTPRGSICHSCGIRC